MSDQIDKMLKEMEEFNKKYGLSTAGLSSSPSKKPTKPKKNVFKDAKKIVGDTAVALGVGFAGAMMLNAAPTVGAVVVLFGPREAIAMKQESPEMSKLKRFRKAFSLGMKGYVKERKQDFQRRRVVKKEGLVSAIIARIDRKNEAIVETMLKQMSKKSRD